MSNQSENNEKKQSFLQRLFFSGGIADLKRSRKIAYIAVMTAFTVVANMFF